MYLFQKSLRAVLATALMTAIIITSLGACATKPQPAAAETDGKTDGKTKPFPTDTLYALLVAEIAGARGQPDIALNNYREQAHATRDISIARRATLIAQYLGAEESALGSAELWNELDPDNVEPQAVIAAQKLKAGLLSEAFDASLKLLSRGYQPLFQTIASQAVKQPQPKQAELLEQFNLALKNYPNNSQLLLGKALLLHYLNKPADALHFAGKAINADEINSAAYLLKAALLEQSGKRKQAIKTLDQRMQLKPYDRRIHLQYARILAAHDMKAAQREFKLLVEKNPFDADLLLTLAIVSKEVGDKATAKEYFEQLLFIQKHQSSAYYYLGQLSEEEKDITRALEQYRRVSDGEEYFYAISAFCRLTLAENNLTQCLQRLDEERVRLPSVGARLFAMEAAFLQEQKQLSRGLNSLNHGLTSYPNDLELLYSRALIYEEMDNLSAAENDLRTILSIDTDNANALNALGYLLSNKTDRLQEGYELITRALALDPNSPAIMDSMGWVLYRMNRTDEALPYLRKAMELYPNHEISAHYGEVLWVTGNQKEARRVWKKGIDDDPDSTIIKETLHRLNAK